MAATNILTAAAVRERARRMFDLGRERRLLHFTLHLDRLPAAADTVLDTIRQNYPALDVPFHARWRHFVVRGEDRWRRLADAIAWPSPAARARAEFDLAIVSVLLDAGAGPDWGYREAIDGERIGRSEGLALASLDMVAGGLFSAKPGDPLRIDAARLEALKPEGLAAAMQVGPGNPLAGIDGRAALLNALGRAVAAEPDVFALDDRPRPGGLFDHLATMAALDGGRLPAPAILEALLAHLGTIWPSRLSLGGVPLGDCWRHRLVTAGDETDGLVPFHKLSQWLAYSLIEPLQRAGIEVTDIDGLTGLAEYRNGGLFLDTGVIALKDPAEAGRSHDPASTLVVEWRALTVALLDEIAALVRARLGVGAAAFPLAKVLEGGTWAAGRRIARERRAHGGPPLAIESDGTVF